jgi:anti-sigma factor RsiW
MQHRTETDGQLEDQAVSSHVRAMMTGHTTDVLSTDRHTVKPWFNGRIDFSPPVADLAQQGFPLVGGRVDYLGGRTVAALVYQRRKHVIDLFIWPVKTDDASGNASSKGYNVIRWSNGGLFFVAVSDLNKTELEQFKNLLPRN